MFFDSAQDEFRLEIHILLLSTQGYIQRAIRHAKQLVLIPYQIFKKMSIPFGHFSKTFVVYEAKNIPDFFKNEGFYVLLVHGTSQFKCYGCKGKILRHVGDYLE